MGNRQGSGGTAGTRPGRRPRSRSRSSPPAGGCGGTEGESAGTARGSERSMPLFPFLREFRQHAEGRFRVEEADPQPVDPRPGRLIDEPDPLPLRVGQGGGGVIHLEAKVVDPLPVLLDEFPHRAVGGGRLDHLDRALPHAKNGGANLLVRDLVGPDQLQPEDVPVEGDRLLEAADGDTDMLDPADHGRPPVGTVYSLTRKGERTRKAKYPAAAEAGIVSTHAHTILIPTFQFTFFRPWESPTPRIAEVMTWVVLIGTPIAVAVRMTTDDDVSAQKPWTGCSSTKSLPTVLMIRHPPIAVPRAIAVAQEAITHSGMWKIGIAP